MNYTLKHWCRDGSDSKLGSYRCQAATLISINTLQDNASRLVCVKMENVTACSPQSSLIYTIVNGSTLFTDRTKTKEGKPSPLRTIKIMKAYLHISLSGSY